MGFISSKFQKDLGVLNSVQILQTQLSQAYIPEPSSIKRRTFGEFQGPKKTSKHLCLLWILSV